MYGFEGVRLSEVMLSISELSVLGGWLGVYKCTSWSDMVGVRQKNKIKYCLLGQYLMSNILIFHRYTELY